MNNLKQWITRTRSCWEWNDWKASLQKKTERYWGRPRWTCASDVPLTQRRLVVLLSKLGEVSPEGQERWFFPSVQHWWGCTWFTGSSSKFPRRETWAWCRQSSEGLPRSWRNWSISVMMRAGTVRLEKRRLCVISSMAINPLWESTTRTQPGSFQWCPVLR